jgi:hypothetical protein
MSRINKYPDNRGNVHPGYLFIFISRDVPGGVIQPGRDLGPGRCHVLPERMKNVVGMCSRIINSRDVPGGVLPDRMSRNNISWMIIIF